MRLIVSLLILILPLAAKARVFSFNNESVSTYLRITGGLSNFNNDAFADSSGANTVFNDKVEFNFSGEIGLAVTVSRVTIRLGVEGLVPQELNPADGNDATNTKLMDINSESLAVIPKLSAEIVLYADDSARLLTGFGVGYALATIKNQYTFTTDGNTAFPGVGDFTEVMKGTVIGGDAFMIVETFFVDNVTFAAEVGYRFYQFNELEHGQATNTIGGAVVEGDPVINNNGSPRELDMKGIYAGIGLRFYIDLGG